MTDKDLAKRFKNAVWDQVLDELWFRFKFGVRLEDVPNEHRQEFSAYMLFMLEKHDCCLARDSDLDGG